VDGAKLFLSLARASVDELIAGLRDKQVMPPLNEPYRQSRALGSVSEITLAPEWDEAAFRAALEDAGFETVGDFWRVLVRASLAGIGQAPQRFACLKSPDYGKSAAAAAAHCGDAKAIVIVRDPLYALDSLKRSRELRGEKLLTWPSLAVNVQHFVRMRDRMKALNAARLYQLRYEDLIADPERCMRAIADWLDMPFEPCLLRPTMSGQDWPGISSFKATKGIETAPAERRLEALTAHEVACIAEHLADFRAEFGYA
jgi:hypothetical protein